MNLSGDTLKAYTLIEHLREHFGNAEMTSSDISFRGPPFCTGICKVLLLPSEPGKGERLPSLPVWADERSRVADCQELPASTPRHLISRNRKYLPANQNLAPAFRDKEVKPERELIH